jgi:hypothetical protein
MKKACFSKQFSQETSVNEGFTTILHEILVKFRHLAV